MDALADLMDQFGIGEIRVSHEQNLVLPHVRKKDLPAIFARLKELGLATPNAGLVTDIIACPGLDYCDLANARSIPVAQNIAERFADLDRQHEIGELKIKISGCINACGHHHAGHIGILGVDKKGVEFYQLQLGGSAAEDASIGEIMGPGFGEHEIVDAVERVVRDLSEPAPERRTLPRHLSARRHGAVQEHGLSGAASCRSLGTALMPKTSSPTVADDAALPDGPVIVSLDALPQRARGAVGAQRAARRAAEVRRIARQRWAKMCSACR